MRRIAAAVAALSGVAAVCAVGQGHRPGVPPWWKRYHTFAQVSTPEQFRSTGARVAIFNHAADPTWGPLGRRLSEHEARARYDELKRGGARVLTYFEGFGDCMVYCAQFETAADGSVVRFPDQPDLPRPVRTFWSWTGIPGSAGPVLGWIGPHNAISDEPFVPRELQGLRATPPRYPDGRAATGKVGARPGDPLSWAVYDACAAKDVEGRVAFTADPPPGWDRLTHERRQELQAGLFTVPAGRGEVPVPAGAKVGDPVLVGSISVHKDLSAPWWRTYTRESVRDIASRGVDGVWCDNYSPWDNFGYPPVQRAFGDWSAVLFARYVAGLPAARQAAIGLKGQSADDVRAAFRTKAAQFATAGSPDKWTDHRWRDDPLWLAFKAFRQRQARNDLAAFDRAIHEGAAAGGRRDFLVGGNDVPFYGLGWTRDGFLDMVNTEVTPGWHMGAGTRGIGIPPLGKMGPFYRAAMCHQRAPHTAAWYYQDGPAEPHRTKQSLARVLLAEAFANGAFLMCDPGQQPRVAGSPATHKAWNSFLHRIEPELGARSPIANVGIVFSPDNQLLDLLPGGFADMDNQPSVFGTWGWATAMTDAHIPYRVVADWRVAAGGLHGLKTLVCPDVEALEESAIAAIRAWVRGGGRLIVTGALGLRHGPSRDFARRARPPSFDADIGRGTVAALPARIGMEYYLGPSRHAQMLGAMTAAIVRPTWLDAAALPATIGISAWRSPDGRAISIDLVNYNVDLDADRIRPASALSIRVATAVSGQRPTVRTLTPDSTASAAASTQGKWLTIRLPRLEHFATLTIARTGTALR